MLENLAFAESFESEQTVLDYTGGVLTTKKWQNPSHETLTGLEN